MIFFAAEKNATREQAIKAWHQIKKMDVPKTYRSWVQPGSKAKFKTKADVEDQDDQTLRSGGFSGLATENLDLGTNLPYCRRTSRRKQGWSSDLRFCGTPRSSQNLEWKHAFPSSFCFGARRRRLTHNSASRVLSENLEAHSKEN